MHTRQVGSRATVRDPRPSWDNGDDAAARCAGGDAGGRDQVAVPDLPAYQRTGTRARLRRG